MARKSQDSGFVIGRRRTVRLMRENGLGARQKRRFMRTADNQHSFPVAPNIIDQDSYATVPNQKWGTISPTVRLAPARHMTGMHTESLA
jgi:putative transposase